jgi:hypothetical protein
MTKRSARLKLQWSGTVTRTTPSELILMEIFFALLFLRYRISPISLYTIVFSFFISQLSQPYRYL